MNWLAENVVGEIPDLDQLSEKARPIVEMRGVHKETVNDDEGSSVEDEDTGSGGC